MKINSSVTVLVTLYKRLVELSVRGRAQLEKGVIPFLVTSKCSDSCWMLPDPQCPDEADWLTF